MYQPPLTLMVWPVIVHVFLDNARYHHAKLVQAWLARSGCRIKLHFRADEYGSI
jgi:hypothetical protein